MVNNLSLRFGIVRAAIIAGIAQANPESIGTNDLPFNPIFDKGLSINIAPRPVSRSLLVSQVQE